MKVLHKIEPDTDRRDVAFTTYQMRNFYRQLYDGCASELDVFCYMQHAFAADLCKAGHRVLDVCCGRGLLIPFLRYRGQTPVFYVGVDAYPPNARWKDGADPRREKEQKDWGFPLYFVESTVDEMSAPAGPYGPFDLIVYTSAIEHMQPAAQAASLVECGKLSKPSTILYLTCPITEPGRDGYEAQYAAHVYEPSELELAEWLTAAGWSIKRRIGLCTGTKHYRKVLSGDDLIAAEKVYQIMPREFALVTIATLFPDCALEMAYVCARKQDDLFGDLG